MQCGGYGYDTSPGYGGVESKWQGEPHWLDLERRCPFRSKWVQEQHLYEERKMVNAQMPSYESWHDFPHWIYEGINIVDGLERKNENGGNT